MQVNGRLRYERWLGQRGRPETQLQLRLEQAIADAEAHAKTDAEAERKRILLAIEADAVCQAAEQRRATRGPQEASLQERRRGHLADRHHVGSTGRAAQQ